MDSKMKKNLLLMVVVWVWAIAEEKPITNGGSLGLGYCLPTS